MHRIITLIVLLLISGVAHADTVTYRLTISNSWTQSKHPIGYPAAAHFSWFGGATHESPAGFWDLGSTASSGFELLAEGGDTREWVGELAAAGARPLEWRHWFCPPQQLHPNCGELSVTFEASSDEPYLTLASMLGPSPDWFVGVHDLALRPNGEWATSLSVPLILHDAGTEAGTTPILDNPPTQDTTHLIAYDPATGNYLPTNTPYAVGELQLELLASPPTGGATLLISAAAAEQGGDGTSWDPAVSANGQFIAFSSDATTLVADEQNGSVRDVYVFNRATGEMRNLTNGGNGPSEDPVMSKDGQWLAFVSRATNLATTVPDSNGAIADIVLAELATGELRLITAGANAPSRAPAISRDGRQVVFDTQATNLASSNYQPLGCENDPTNPELPCYNNVLHYDRIRDVTVVLTQGGTTDSRAASISESGGWASYISGAFGGVVAMNLNTGERQALPLGLPLETLGFSRPSISALGRWVAIHTTPPSGPTSLHLYDLVNEVAHALGEEAQLPGEFSSNERYLVYSSTASNPDGSDPNGNIRDIFRVDLSSNEPFSTRRITAGGNLGSGGPVISGDGSVVVWDSQASNFVEDNNGELFDVFLREVSADPVPAPTNNPPTADAQAFTIDTGDVVVITLNGFDPEGAPLEFEILRNPINGSLSGAPPNLTYSVNPGYTGADSFTFSVSDGEQASAPATISLTVNAANTVPVAVAQALTTPAATDLVITLTGTDPDLNNEPLAFSIDQLPANGFLRGTLPNLVYTPQSGFVGVDRFTFKVSDATSTSAAASITIDVAAPAGPADNPPAANPQSISTAQQTPVAIVLSGTSANNDALTFSFATLPENGSLSGAAPSFVYTPDANFAGPDSFSFTATDVQGTSAPATVSIKVTDPDVQLLAAVLPASRSVAVGTTATAFATLINFGGTTARNCRLIPPNNIAAEFFFQVTNSATNEAIGPRDTPTLIPAGGSQAFVFGITPTQEISATEVALDFSCENSTGAPSFVGLNTLLLSASQTAGPDLIALAATVTNDGVMQMAGNSGFFSAATINVGSTATISVSADTGEASLPMALSLCETDPATSICINPVQPRAEPVEVEIVPGGSPTFAVFATATGPVSLDPANKRVFLRFSDAEGEVKGATSVAVLNTE